MRKQGRTIWNDRNAACMDACLLCPHAHAAYCTTSPYLTYSVSDGNPSSFQASQRCRRPTGGSSPLFSVHETGASGLVCPCGEEFFPGLSRGLGHLDFGLARGADRYSSVVKGRVEDWASFGRWAYLHASGRCLCSSSTGNWVVRRGGRDGRDGSGRE